MRRIIGLMSGTSLDGLDIALCTIYGSGKESKLHLEKFTTLDYPADFRDQVRQVFAKREIDQQVLCGLHGQIGVLHGQMVNQALSGWDVPAQDVDCIASHGQTVYHAPRHLTNDLRFPDSTLQIGEADHIASATGIITIADFRQKHIAHGGQGAPLAVYGDYLLFSDPAENRFLLNIGGISNFTFLPSDQSDQQAYATDLGPGNTMMNQYVLEQYGLEMDRDAHIARSGTVEKQLLTALLTEPFLDQSFPKTTGPELFNLDYLKQAQSRSGQLDIPSENVMATLNMFSALAITQGIKRAAKDIEQYTVFVSGGGLHNELLLEHIRASLNGARVTTFSELGVNPDAKEACLFAILANETLAGAPANVSAIKDSPAVCMGKVSFPY